MRKLILQVQLTVNGFNGGPNGELDWMEWDWDDGIKKYVSDLTDSVDTILLGRKMTDGFVNHWAGVLKNPADESYAFAKKMVDYPKVVFTKTLDKSAWVNTVLAKGSLSYEVGKLKKLGGKDIIVYGGSGFVTSLVKSNLIDEYYLFINPSAIGRGMTIFSELDSKMDLMLENAKVFDCGIVLLKYVPK